VLKDARLRKGQPLDDNKRLKFISKNPKMFNLNNRRSKNDDGDVTIMESETSVRRSISEENITPRDTSMNSPPDLTAKQTHKKRSLSNESKKKKMPGNTKAENRVERR
jgi:hypothetical protein